jgi:hypothetical protein
MARAEDSLIISLLRDAAFGEAYERYPLCAFSVLTALGLVQEAYNDDLPTLQLRRLFAEAYYDRQAKNVKPKATSDGGG